MASRRLSSSEKYSIALLVCLSFLAAVSGEIIVSPKDAESSIGETAEFVCTSTLGSIEWHHSRAGRHIPEIVYKDGYIYNGYKGRFKAENCSSVGSECRLTIQNVGFDDAGTYTCVETSDESNQKEAHLIAFEQYPSTKFCVSKIICSSECDAMEMCCNMKYSENLVAIMEWRDSAGNLVPSATIIINGTTTSTVQLNGGHSRSASYTCKVTYSTNSFESKYNWTYIPQDLLSSKTEQHGWNQQMTFFVIVIVALFCIIFGLIGYNRHKTLKRKHKWRNCSTARVEHDPVQSEDIMEQLMVQKTSLSNSDPEVDGSWIEGVIAPRTKANKNQSIHGLSIIDDEVFIVTREGCVIEVFDLNSFDFKRAWTVAGLINPNDMVSCPKLKQLYICDWKKSAEDKEILCVDKNGTVKARWISETDKGRLSITKESNVIVAESWYNSIKEYSPFGQLIKKFQTGRDKLHLWHAIKLLDGNFVASFGDTQDIFQDVCIFDSQGKELQSFANTLPSSIKEPIKVPRTLAVDTDGNIYVADLYNGRIIMLTSELRWKGEIHATKTGETIRGPVRICLHESNNKRQLLVADSTKENGKWTDGKILILDIER